MAQEIELPRAVREEAAEAERAFVEAQTAANEPVSETAPTQTEKTDAEPIGVVQPLTPAPAPSTPEAAQVELPPEPQSELAPEKDVAAELQAKHERLQHSHDVLKGKYAKEVPRLHAELRGEREARARVEAELAEAKKAQAPPVDPKNPYGLTDAELELGPEVSAVAEKIAKRLTAQSLAELEKKIPQRQAEPPVDPFWENLLIEEPDAIEINDDPAFRQWLTGTVYGVSRQKLIQDAQREGDSQRAAAMMSDWRVSGQSAANTTAGGSQQAAQSAKQTTRPSIAAQVAPNTVGASPAPAQKKTYTLAQYEETITNIVKGRYMPQDVAKLQAELDQALVEGRVR